MRRNILDLKRLEQRVNRTYFQTGIHDILFGFMFILYSAGCGFVISGFDESRPKPSIISILIIAFSPLILMALHRKFVVPRVGFYQSRKISIPWILLVSYLILALFLIFAACVAGFWQESIGFDPWIRWTPIGFGLLLGTCYFYCYRTFGILAYGLLGVVTLLLGAGLTLMPFPESDLGLLWFFALVGVLSILWGGYSFHRFSRRFPREEESPSEEAPHEEER